MIQLIAWIQFWIIVSAALAVLYIGYCWVMRRDERFAMHRFALLAIIIFSLSTPLLMTGVYKLLNIIDLNRASANTLSNANRWNGLIINAMQQPVATKSGFPFPWHWLSLTVIGISVMLMGRFIYQLVRLLGVYRQSEVNDFGEFSLVKSSAIQQPFSFWHWIFVPVNFNHDNDQNEILEHEKIHVSQVHSVDLLLVELLAAAMWFNPVMWMIRKRIRLIHEYLADEGALSTGIDARRYKALLLNQVTEERLICLSSSFNHSLIKKRMIMISKNKSNEKSSMRLLAFVPLSLVMLALVMGLKGVMPDVAQASVIDLSPGGVFASDSAKIQTIGSIFGDKFTCFVDGKQISSNDSWPEGMHGLEIDTVTNTVNFYTNAESVVAKKEEPKSQPDLSTAKFIVDGVSVSNIDNIKSDDIQVIEVDKVNNVVTVTTKRNNSLVILDGVAQAKSFNIESLKPNTIESVDVIKDQAMVKKYTSKNYDAVIVIKTKKGN